MRRFIIRIHDQILWSNEIKEYHEGGHLAAVRETTTAHILVAKI
jgi:hypothetical protein